MIGQISHIETIESLTNYHFKKMEEGVAVLLEAHKVDVQSKQMANLSFKSQAVLSPDTSSPYTHISLNFAIEDTALLCDELMQTVTKEFLGNLGYLNQPYMIVRHLDQEHPHTHIITSDVKDNGTKVNKHNEYYRIKDICRSLEQKYGFRIVPNVKEDKQEAIHIVNESDYKNYLKAAVKETLSLKPKRFSDFQKVLKEIYYIETFTTTTKTGKNGVSFALTDGSGSRYVEEKGTIALAGSTLSNAYSYNKLSEQIQANYASAPKRYRYMLNFQDKLNESLYYFDAISFKDIARYKPELKVILKDNTPSLLVDLKGRCLFSSNELKTLHADKLAKDTTYLNLHKSDKDHPSLLTQIYSEAIRAYGGDVSKGMKVSYFISHIMDQSVLADYLAHSKTLEVYSSYLSHEQLTAIYQLQDFNKEMYHELFTKTEWNSEQQFLEVTKQFSQLNSSEIDVKNFFLSKERKDFIATSIGQFSTQFFNHQYKRQHKGEVVKLPYPYRSVTVSQLFLFHQHFDIEKLSVSISNDFSSFLNERLFKDMIEQKTKVQLTPQAFIGYFNQRGFSFELNENGNVQLRFLALKAYSYSKLNDFLKEEIQQQSIPQLVEKNLSAVELRLNCDIKNWSRVEQLIGNGSTEEQVLIVENPDYKAFYEQKSLVKNIDTTLRQIAKQLELDYFSELIPYIKVHKEDFVKQIGEQFKTNGIGFNYTYIDTYLNNLVSDSSYKTLKAEEKQRIEAFISRVNQFKDPSTLLALTGFYNTDSVMSERNGLYHFDHRVNERVVDGFKNDPSFKYDTYVFKDLIHHYYSNLDSPLFIAVLEKYKDYLESKDYQVLSTYAQQSYLRYYSNELKGVAVEERLDFLTSKGIMVFKEGENAYVLKLMHFDQTIVFGHDDSIKLVPNLDKQAIVFEKHNYVNKDDFIAHLHFHNALERGDYQSAAFEIKKSSIQPFLSQTDAVMHYDHLLEKFNELNSKSNSTYLNDLVGLFQSFQNKKTQQKDQHGKDNQKKKRRNKGRDLS